MEVALSTTSTHNNYKQLNNNNLQKPEWVKGCCTKVNITSESITLDIYCHPLFGNAQDLEVQRVYWQGENISLGKLFMFRKAHIRIAERSSYSIPPEQTRLIINITIKVGGSSQAGQQSLQCDVVCSGPFILD
jgi:hypothetical protein